MLPNRPEIVGCRSCNRDFNIRELSTTICEIEVGRCPQCSRELLRQDRTKASQSAASSTALDVGAIEEALSEHAKRGFPFTRRNPATVSISSEAICWSVQADKSTFALEVSYSEERRSAVDLRLVTRIDSEILDFSDDKLINGLDVIAASHGVDLFGRKRSFTDLTNPADPDASGKQAILGVSQTLRLRTLREEVFAPVLSRLDAALKDMLAALPKPT